LCSNLSPARVIYLLSQSYEPMTILFLQWVANCPDFTIYST